MKNTFEDIQQLHRAGNLVEAKQGYLDFIKEHPDHIEAMHYLGLLYAEQGEMDSAQYYLEHAVKLNPNDLSMQLHLANVYKARSNYAEAFRILNDVIKDYPQFAAAYNNLGTLYYAQEQWQDAVRSYKTAIDLRPDYIDAYYNLGLALNKEGHSSEAINAYRALIELAPQHPGGHFQLGCLLMEQNNYQAAIDEFYIVEQEHPFHFETQTNLATSFLKLGWLEKAKTHYLKALNIMPEDVQILFNLGVIAMQQGKTRDAIELYNRILKVSPDHYEAHNNLAVSFLSVKNREKALEHFCEVLRINSDDEAVQHTIKILKRDKTLSASPPEYIRSLFDSYADHYDAHITQTLNYKVPKAIYEMLANRYDAAFRMDILDLGCGTGLCGELFKAPNHVLTGVDISGQMLAVAAGKNIYQSLVESDILTYLKNQHQAFDLVIAGDVLNYFGDLEAVFADVHQALRPHGLFVFNTEIDSEHDYEMTESGRFAHNSAYIEKLIKEARFERLDYKRIQIRSQQDVAVEGHLYLLKKGN